MEFTNEQIALAMEAKSLDELTALAKEKNIELTEELTEAFNRKCRVVCELSEDELERVSGGIDTGTIPQWEVYEPFTNDSLPNCDKKFYYTRESVNYTSLQQQVSVAYLRFDDQWDIADIWNWQGTGYVTVEFLLNDCRVYRI